MQLAGNSELQRLLLANVFIFAGSVAQGASGIGLALIAAPLLSLLDPHYVPVPIVVSTFLLSLLMFFRNREHIHTAGVGRILAGYLPGAALGAVLLRMYRPSDFTIVIGALVLAAVLLSATKLKLNPTPVATIVAGSLAGLMGTISAVTGPPLALLYQNESGARVRGTLGTTYIAAAVVTISAYGAGGRLTIQALLVSAAVLPGTALGFLVSRPLSRFVDRGYMRFAILLLSGLSAAALILTRVLVL